MDAGLIARGLLVPFVFRDLEIQPSCGLYSTFNFAACVRGEKPTGDGGI